MSLFSIILGKPSRFDKQNNKLLSGSAGDWFRRELSKLNINDFYLSTSFTVDKNKLQNSKVILALGAETLSVPFGLQDITLNEQRGSPYIWNAPNGNQIPVIFSYTPQDCNDIKDYEGRLNNFGIDGNAIEEFDNDSEDEKDLGKAHGKTKRKNFKFWLMKDLAKANRIFHNGLNVIPHKLEIFNSSEEIIYELTHTKNQFFYIDIESDPESNQDITVISYCFEPLDNIDYAVPVPSIKVVPFRRYNFTPAYEDMAGIIRAIAIAMRDNVTVTHNGSTFDIPIITLKHHIPFGRRHYDTMNAHHRCYPEVEKSLGHVISLYTDQPYHKNTSGTFRPWNNKQEQQLWTYNGIDVHTMVLVRRAIDIYAKRIGAIESIQQSNDSIAPYLTLTFTGIKINEELRVKHIAHNDRRINCYLRILHTLTGFPLNPRSTKQMPQYLFGKPKEGGLGLTPVSYSSTTGKPKCDAKAIIKLYVKHPKIAALPVIIGIRRLQKECEAISFSPIQW